MDIMDINFFHPCDNPITIIGRYYYNEETELSVVNPGSGSSRIVSQQSALSSCS